MVVDEDERARPLTEGDTKRVARRDENAVEATRGDAASRAKPVASVEGKNPQLFVVQSRKLISGPCVDRSRFRKSEERREMACRHGPSPQLDGRGDARRLRAPYAAARTELANSCARKAVESPVVLEEASGQNLHGLGCAPRAEQERDQLFVAQRADANVKQALARSERGRRRPFCGRLHACKRARLVPSTH